MSLSGGERRRVEIACVGGLSRKSKVILRRWTHSPVVDRPISVNDIKKIHKQLKERNIGVLITDHNARENLRCLWKTLCESR